MIIDVKETLAGTELANKSNQIIETIGAKVVRAELSGLASKYGITIAGINAYTLARVLRDPVKVRIQPTRELPEIKEGTPEEKEEETTKKKSKFKKKR